MRRKIIPFFILVLPLFILVFALTSCGGNCLVQFDTKGGSEIASQNVGKGEKVTKPIDPTKEGYTFDDWYYQGERWSFVGYTVTGDMTLEAKWDINSYSLYLTLNDDKAGTISSTSGSYNYDELITIEAITNDGYTFNGWYDETNQVSNQEKYTFNMPAENLRYTARWTANTNTPYKVEHYLQNIEDSNYTLYETDTLVGITDTLTQGIVKSYEGFTSPLITQVNINGDESTILKLYYERNSYDIELGINNSKAGSISDVSGTYKYNESIKIDAITNPGYTFDGWYKNDELYIEKESFDYIVGAEDASFEARYTAKKYTVTLDNQTEEAITWQGLDESEYDCDDQITISVNNFSGKHLIWYFNDTLVAFGNSYTFTVPAEDLVIKLLLSDTLENLFYTRNNNKVYFGTYPQSEVTDSQLIEELNALAGPKPTSTDSYNWIDYKYYIESKIESFMFYQDIDYDDNGTYDYRGVYFIKYRPYLLSRPESSSNDYQVGYFINTIYWFNYDPIEWNILTESDGKALVHANLILDSREFYPDFNHSRNEFEHNGGNGYANDYELSFIRKFLNDDFYNMTFNCLEKMFIEITEVDNSCSSTNIPSDFSFSRNNTNDKMFLLSYQEFLTYYGYGSGGKTPGTNYAVCQGLGGNPETHESDWWLRSPFYNNEGGSCDTLVFIGSYDYGCSFETVESLSGIRPACYITI